MDPKKDVLKSISTYPLSSLPASRAEQVNEVLYSLANAVNTTLDLDELYLAIHQSLGKIFDVSNFFIAIVNNTEKTLYFPYFVDTTDDDFTPITNFDTSDSLTGLIVTNKRPLLLNSDELKEREKHKGVWGPLPLIWMGVPLIIREEVIGVIAVQSYTNADLFSKHDLDLLAAISDQTAMAIDRKQSLQNLKESEQRFRQLFEQSNDAIIIHNHHGKILDCNTRAIEMLDYKLEQLLKMKLIDLHTKNGLTICENALGEVKKSGHVRFESILSKSDGTHLDVEISSRIIDNKDNGIIQGIIRDITANKKIEKKLLKSEEKYRSLFHNALVGLFRTDETGRKLFECNDALARMAGYQNRLDFIKHYDGLKVFTRPKKMIGIFKKVKLQGTISENKVKIRRKNGEIGWVKFSATFYPEQNWVEGVVVDITETKKINEEKIHLQQKLEQSRKMEALGMLAGGVAHDLNNILAGIISYPELLLIQLPNNHELRKPLETILEAGRRGALIVSDMLTLARSAASIKEPCNLNKLIKTHMKSAEYRQLLSLYPEVKIKTELQAEPAIIFCSTVHIKKCLMNLFTNAFEAIEGPGCVTCLTENTGDYIILKVQDTGPGIAAKDTNHIFEPFYTKKNMGRSGTGLGLTIVWNTMEDHDGKVMVKNNRTGTCFSLQFPVSNLQIETIDAQPEIIPGNGELILIVDDNEQVRDIASQILTTLGYKTQIAASGEEAVDYLQNHQVDLVLLDMIMDPGMNGFQAYTEISKLHPGQKAIIASGFSKNENVKAALQSGVGRFIKKPYSIELLSQAIKAELTE